MRSLQDSSREPDTKLSGPSRTEGFGSCKTNQNLNRKGPMSSLADSDSERSVGRLAPLLIAALLLAACEFFREIGLDHPTVSQILDATGAGRSRAYELREALLRWLPKLLQPAGRPAKPAGDVSSDAAAAITRAVLAFVMSHPGCVSDSHERRRYGDSFRRFVLELRREHSDIDLDFFAVAIDVPHATLKDWLRNPTPHAPKPVAEPEPANLTANDTDSARPRAGTDAAHIETVLAAYRSWHGGFVDFCTHVLHDLRIPFKRTLIAHILEVEGVRLPRRRSGRSPDEEALRGAFQTFFPGAQWVGDGSPIDVVVGSDRFRFNLELMVDAHTGAFVGIGFRDEEDSAAVVEAFDDAVETTGAPALALLLDNKVANHTPEVDAALGDTLRMRSTKGRPQNKAHCEGAFGLFQQTVPALVLDATNPRETARSMLSLVTQTWARTLNHRPRADRNGRSRVDLYDTDDVSDDQIAHARASLQERCRKQDLARQTLEARQDPQTRQVLDETFALLDLDDPQRHFRNTIARYALPVVLTAIAIFTGKRQAGTLPDNVDARYLLGIAQNVSVQREGLAIAEQLLQLRLQARDRRLAHLQGARDAALNFQADPVRLVDIFVDHATSSSRRIDRLFWLSAVAQLILEHARDDPAHLFRLAAHRVHAAYAVPHRERAEAVTFLADKILPID